LPDKKVESHWITDYTAVEMQNREAADRIEAQAAEIDRLREALHTPLAFIEALHENDPDDQIEDNGMTVLDGLKQQAPSIIKTIREALEGKAEQ
jgi:hypothetical protein